MKWAKALGEFVTIHANGLEIVGKFGADGITDGKFPNGDTYTWKKDAEVNDTKIICQVLINLTQLF